MKNNFPVVLSLLLLLSACKKQDTVSPIETQTAILTSGNWHLTASTIDGLFDVYATLPDCRKDDYYHYNTTGMVETNEGPSTCNATDPQIQHAQWRFLNEYANTIEIGGNKYYVEFLDYNVFKIRTATTNPFVDKRILTYGR